MLISLNPQFSPFTKALLLLVLCAGYWPGVGARADADTAPITTRPWQEAVLSVTDLDASARFFREIGGYQDKARGAVSAAEIASWGLSPEAAGEMLILGKAGEDQANLRLIRFDNVGRRAPMRPGARAWDTGCYFSLMVRMKDIQAVYDDAIAMGWWTETPITYLEFGASRLNITIFRGPDGIQVQGYERLSPPLPPGIPPFERLTRPFNIMQMVRDRDVAYEFFTRTLGFATFYNGKPYTASTPTPTPLGLPLNLTTSVPYLAGIVYPVPGEFGRMEMIEIRGLDGHDYSDRCEAPNLGILAVRFEVADAAAAAAELVSRGWLVARALERVEITLLGQIDIFSIKSPDGAIIQFYSPAGE